LDEFFAALLTTIEGVGVVLAGEFKEGTTTGTGVEVGTGGAIFLKKGRVRLPQPGILTSHPVEIMRRTNNMAEKMDRLFRVSRNPESLVEMIKVSTT
jgi:hypothetical protein